MGILEQLVSPPTSEHTVLLNFIQVIALLIFLPFVSMLFGGTVLSVFYRYLYNRTKNPLHLRFSVDILDKLSFSRNVGWGMGIIPLISITVVYAQFLYGTGVISVPLLFLSVVLYSVSFFLIYSYKNTFLIKSVLESLKKQINSKNELTNLPENVKEYEEKILISNIRFGNIGLALMIVASFLFISGIVISLNVDEWQKVTGILSLLVNGKIWLFFLFFIAASFSISGAGILYFFFVWQGGLKNMGDEYSDYSKKIATYISLLSSVVLPVFLILNFIFQPQSSLSASNFVLAGITVILILLVCNLLYASIKNSEIKYSGGVVFLLFIAFTFIIIQQQIAFGNSIKPHLYSVTQKADEMARQLTQKNVKPVEINAEEIFNAKCIACHKFDVKLVGPPYQETVPKYNGDVKKLAAYILNPVKINPDYPPMPNQGLKEKEAEALAQWLIQKTTGK